MSSNETSIQVANLSKCYLIYGKPQDRLKQSIYPRVRRIVGLAPQQYYREFWALNNVSFEVKKGETVGIIGRNGSGKSTLLQLICGTLNPTAGSVETKGRVAALLELGSGFNPEFTGRENVYMNGAVLGLTKAEIDTRFDEIAAFADIGQFLEQPVKTYSSGMYVRLAFSVAVHTDPHIMIVDEALSVGDIRFQSKCLRRLNELKDRGCSILFVSHSPSMVEAFCDRAIWLDQGAIREAGKPGTVVRNFVNHMMHGAQERASSTDDSDMSEFVATADEGWQWVAVRSGHNTKSLNGSCFTRVRVKVGDKFNASFLPCAPTCIDVQAEFYAAESIELPLCGLGIMNELNEPVVHCNTYNVPLPVVPIPPDTIATLRFRATLPALRPGQYLLALGVDVGHLGSHRLCCHIYDAWAFQVLMPEDGKAQSGYIQMQDATFDISWTGGPK